LFFETIYELRIRMPFSGAVLAELDPLPRRPFSFNLAVLRFHQQYYCLGIKWLHRGEFP